MVDKELLKELREAIASFYCYWTGLGKINGGYTKVLSMTAKHVGQGRYRCKGQVEYGEQDTGDGCSSRTEEPFDVQLRKDKTVGWTLSNKQKTQELTFEGRNQHHKTRCASTGP